MQFNYICDKCNKEYIEHRLVTVEQLHTDCECGGKYIHA